MKGLMNLSGAINFSVLGLVLAFNVGLLFEFVLLFYFFKRKVKNLEVKKILKSFVKVVISSFLMGIIAYYLVPLAREITTSSLLQFSFVSLVSFLIYAILTIALKMPEINAVKRLIFRNGN
jgi:peptidoglycan biosynthesis protein MviN/MurJ (putative lipid II flippase)